MFDNVGRFKLVDLFTPHLGFRNQVNELFDKFIGSEDRYDAVIVDFDGVISVNYAWTHQYIRNVNAVNLPVASINVPKSIKPMFAIVINRMKVDGEFEFIDSLKYDGDLTRIEDALGAVGHRFVRGLVVMGY